MNKKNNLLKLLLCMVMICLLLTGCGKEQSAEPTEQKTEQTAQKDNTKDQKETKKAKSDVEALKEENQIPEDGVITKEQMETIAGKEGEYRFNGETEDGIHYTWIYDGSKIQNPVEQKLKVEFGTEDLDEIKEKADNAPYALQVKLQKMELAAPATLEVTLNEKWDADRVLYCIYENDTIYQLDGKAEIENVKAADAGGDSKDNAETSDETNGDNAGEVSKITFHVTKADGDVYVLLGGSSEGSDENVQNAAGEAGSTSGEVTGDSEDSSEADESDDSGSSSDSSSDSSSQEDSHTCTISIECSSILDNWDDLKSSKAEFVPSDGWILYPSEISFTPGDTVFDVLKSACSQAGIQMSSKYTPLYGSYYIEGINQLYEFDCGQNSGWMYSVNGWFPNYGCSEYTVEDGDTIEWKYTCNLGSDVGNSYGG